jgi:hypothetical protein
MKNRINRIPLVAVNRSLRAIGESVNRDSFARPVRSFVECDEVAAINRSLERYGDVSIADEDLEPVFEIDELAEINRSLEWLGDVNIEAEDLEPVFEVDEVAAYNRSLEWHGDVSVNAADLCRV